MEKEPNQNYPRYITDRLALLEFNEIQHELNRIQNHKAAERLRSIIEEDFKAFNIDP